MKSKLIKKIIDDTMMRINYRNLIKKTVGLENMTIQFYRDMVLKQGYDLITVSYK